MRDRILAVTDSTTDPFASEISYHRSCWKKFIRPLYEAGTESDFKVHMPNVMLSEVKHMFLEHVRHVILELSEPRTLQGLVSDYNDNLKNFGYDINKTRSSYVKQMIEDEFGTSVGFHERFHKNQSIIVYDTSAGGSYVEAALYAWGITDDQLLNVAAKRMRENISFDDHLQWPPHVQDLCKSENPTSLLRKFVTWLKAPNFANFADPCDDPEIVSLSSLLWSYITGRRTASKI
jgi:hypothetical protein